MNISEKEILFIREHLSKIERMDAKGMRKYYATNQIRHIRQMLNRIERRGKKTLL